MAVEILLSAFPFLEGVGSGVLLYPNPAADWARALLPEGWSGAWSLTTGAYVLTARSGERVLVGRVLKQ